MPVLNIITYCLSNQIDSVHFLDSETNSLGSLTECLDTQTRFVDSHIMGPDTQADRFGDWEK